MPLIALPPFIFTFGRRRQSTASVLDYPHGADPARILRKDARIALVEGFKTEEMVGREPREPLFNRTWILDEVIETHGRIRRVGRMPGLLVEELW